MNKGYVYVLTNPSFKEDWVKIGKSIREPEVRGKELYNTAVPLPYEIYATLKTAKYSEAEKNIHRSIDRISKLRIAPNREFFNIPPEKVYEILCDIAELLDDAEVQLYGDNLKVNKKSPSGVKRITGERFDFYNKGIKDGSIIYFAEDKNITAIVAGPRQVLFENELWYLSPLARELLSRMHKENTSGAYQGPLFFTYNGKRLTEIDSIKEEL
jgi:hypothetical protein